MLRTFITGIAALLVLSSFSGGAARASILELKSQDGVKITLTYDHERKVFPSDKPLTMEYASNLTVTAEGISSDRAEVDTVIVLNQRTTSTCGFQRNDSHKVYSLRLAYDPSKRAYSGFFPTYALLTMDGGAKIPVYKVFQESLPLSGSAECYTINSALELAIVVNGVWQTDPINKSHNFRLNF